MTVENKENGHYALKGKFKSLQKKINGISKRHPKIKHLIISLSSFARKKTAFLRQCAAQKVEDFSKLRPQMKRRKILKLSFISMVLLPFFLGTLYYTFIASDRYVSGAGFSVRSVGNMSKIDALGALTGISGGESTASDSYIILKYLKSHDVVNKLQKDFDFQTKYSDKSIDFISRLSSNASAEEVVEYWENMIKISFESTSGIVTFNVETFNSDDAHKIAVLLLKYAKNLINNLSKKAQKDTILYAESEVKRSEERLQKALQQIRIFREKENSIDPGKSALLQIELLGTLEKQLLNIKARILVLEQSVDQDAPSMRLLNRQADALEKQITEKSVEISSREKAVQTGKMPLSGLLATYETLEAERNFSQQAYTTSLASLENAYIEANRQQRYLAVYSNPALPESPLYPRRILNIFLLLLILTGIWTVCVLIAYSIRDHMS